MAVKYKKRTRPLNRVIYEFMTDAMYQLHANMFTQHVWPTLVYPGYDAINEYRRVRGQWYSTGEGERSVEARIINANNPADIAMVFSFNDYLRFVDMGVGDGTKLGGVDSSHKARYKTTYTQKWNRRAGRSQRPAIMMEMRHVQSRVCGYVQDYYGLKGQTYLAEGIEGMAMQI